MLGLCAAFELSRRGHAVRVIDPGGANASSVAAGMIAPAMEAAIDQAAPEQAALFRAGRDLWPAFAQAAGISLNARPAEWRGRRPGNWRNAWRRWVSRRAATATRWSPTRICRSSRSRPWRRCGPPWALRS
ncbi:FAD-binding oxidoreductase [Brevundimonas albigilva]|nr:FAD-binding oxidoreductase [Brevundimonas albigilva]